MPTTPTVNRLQNSVTRISRVTFAFVALFVGVIIVSDAWNLITHAVIVQRWIVAAALLAFNALIWYAARQKGGAGYYKFLLYAQILAFIAFATVLVYMQRGIASRSVALYTIPIVTAAALASRAALYTTATLCTAAYSLASVHYFYSNYGEAYKVELYGELAFYCGLFFVVAALLNAVILRKSD